MRVAIYVRVSREGQTVDNQILPLKQYCERMGYQYEIHSEQESTRKTRPVQWELYNKLLRKEYDGLVIYKFDRWARSTRELVEHMENLFNKGVMVFSYSENIDLSSSMGRAMLTIISAFAQLERDIIRERTIAGLQRAKAQGKKLGRPFVQFTAKDPPLEMVKRLLGEAKEVKEIARLLETSKYRVEKAIRHIQKQAIGSEGGV